MPELTQRGPDLIPSHVAVRKRLAEHLTEAQLLRRLLRIAEDAAVERNRLATLDTPVVGEGVATR